MRKGLCCECEFYTTFFWAYHICIELVSLMLHTQFLALRDIKNREYKSDFILKMGCKLEA